MLEDFVLGTVTVFWLYFIYACIYIYTYTYTVVYLYMHDKQIHIHIYVCIYLITSLFTCTCTYICMYGRISIHVRPWVHIIFCLFSSHRFLWPARSGKGYGKGIFATGRTALGVAGLVGEGGCKMLRLKDYCAL